MIYMLASLIIGSLIFIHDIKKLEEHITYLGYKSQNNAVIYFTVWFLMCLLMPLTLISFIANVFKKK